MSIKVCVHKINRGFGEETYALRFDDTNLEPVALAIAKWVHNLELTFDGCDAAIICRTIRQFAPCPNCAGPLPAPADVKITLFPGPPPIVNPFPNSQEEKPCGDDH